MLRSAKCQTKWGNAVKCPRSFIAPRDGEKRKKKKRKKREVNAAPRCETIQKPVIGSMRARQKHHTTAREHRTCATHHHQPDCHPLLCITKFRIKASAAHERPCQRRNFRSKYLGRNFCTILPLYHVETRPPNGMGSTPRDV